MGITARRVLLALASLLLALPIVSSADVGDIPELTTTSQVDVRQRRSQVEFMTEESGTNVQGTDDPGGAGQHRGSLSNGDWVKLDEFSANG